MDNEDRKLILNNLDKLAEATEYFVMSKQCLEKEILTKTMANNIQSDGKDDNQRNLLLFEKITHRGPTGERKL
jgi:hypothetical protein